MLQIRKIIEYKNLSEKNLNLKNFNLDYLIVLRFNKELMSMSSKDFIEPIIILSLRFFLGLIEN